MLIEAPVLTQPESGTTYVVYSGTSLNGLGCVLTQLGHDLELDVIVFALKIQSQYLYSNKCHANVVANALSRKSSLFALRALNAHLALNANGSVLVELKTKPLFLQ
ncbi:Integrase, catalytic core [Gossypium australe]|uniref:Integrase, catalytic core n=1 Tax=Gossypium australe TaxID=47621 RepID=A0A5B6VN37_9ROSI|nr:Integrase, catalytic core [Gossypium australe]